MSDIDDILNQIDKINPLATFLSDSSLSIVDDYIDTGSYALNAIISGKTNGGVPINRVTLIAGPTQCGKSFIIQKLVAAAQKKGLIAVVFDTENAITPEGAVSLGVDIAKVKYVPEMVIEECRNTLYKFLMAAKERGVRNKFFVAIDSLANLQSILEISRMEKGNTSSDMGSKARAMGTLMQTATNLATQTGTTMVFSNHIYDDPTALFPSIEKCMPGGRKVGYLPSVTVQLARKPIKDDGGKTTDTKLVAGQKKYSGIEMRALTVKNRFIQQYLEANIFLSFSSGLDKYYGLLEMAKSLNVIEQTGSTYVLGGEKLGYYSSFRKSTELWEDVIIPRINEKIKTEWAYSNSVSDVPNDEIIS
jgi:recombination protein RecA